MTPAADRHLLFGLLALQNGLIDPVQLVAAFQTWTRDKSKSLADRGRPNTARRRRSCRSWPTPNPGAPGTR